MLRKMTPERTFPPPAEQLLRLRHRRTELDNAIRLLEEIRLIRLKRPPELAAIISRTRRVA
jgi:hypothetical protein